MPKLDRSGLGLLLSAGVAAWIVENDPFGVQEVQGKRASARNMPSLRSAPARPPCLLRARLAAPGGLALPGKRPAHWAPCHGLGCSSPPPPRPPVTPAWTVYYSRAARLLTYAPAHSPACSPAQASEEGAAPRDLRRREAAQDARAPRARANPSLNPEPHPSPNPNKARYYRELALSRTLPLALALALALARCATTEG